MSIPLSELQNCFEGVIPSMIATTDKAGTPNISFLSQVVRVDDDHVALSNQFFSKTIANVRATGCAGLLLVDAQSGRQYVIDMRFEQAVSDGALFEGMAAQIRAIAGQTGFGHIMKLRSADIYRVIACREVLMQGFEPPPEPSKPEPARLAAVARLVAAVGASADADAMLDIVLDGVISDFGFQSAMILVPDETGAALHTLSSRGYDHLGVGSEVKMGEGVIGQAATQRRAIRVSDMSRGRRIADAVRATLDLEQQRSVPLPGLVEPQSQIALPMISKGRFFGVLFAESETRFAFTSEDEDALGAIAAHLATSLRLAEIDAKDPVLPSLDPTANDDGIAVEFSVKYYSFDDSIFIDGDYIIKGVPGRLLMHFLSDFVADGKSKFTNREVRLDQSLRLPSLKDNLETRLILLRRRLEEKDAPVRLLRPERGRIQLDVKGTPRLETISNSEN